jgi:uncharacterized membrane protein YhaH (DUF805 family)
MSQADPTAELAKDVPAGSLFGFRGRIGPKRYWAHIAGALAALAGTFVFAASAADPRGSDAGLLVAFPLLALFVWLLAAAMTQRLRDAGKPPVLALGFMILLLGALFLSMALIEVAPYAGLIGFFAILAVVGHIDASSNRKAGSA